MMLRASSEAEGQVANLESVVAGESADSKLPAGDALLHFAEVALNDDADAITSARDRVAAALGEPAMIDAAAVIANFQRMVRIADGTGIPLDAVVVAFSEDIREDLGLNEFA